MPLPAHVKVRRECLSFVVLGATGNLAQKKLLPSLFNLYANGHLPPRTLIVCAGRPAHSDAEFNRITAAGLKEFLDGASVAKAARGDPSAKVTRQQSLSAGIDDLDLEFRASLGDPGRGKRDPPKDKPPLPPPTLRDIGGCANTSARSSYANLTDLDAVNTDDQGVNGSSQTKEHKAGRSPLKPSAAVAMSGIARSQCPPEFLIDEFLERVRYACVPDCATASAANTHLSDVFDIVKEHETKNETGNAPGRNRLYYLAMPHELYLPAADAIHRNGRSPGNGWTRIVVEKPFGSDLISARAMHVSLKEHWAERDLYRIDRYLGKEVIDNLLVMRFANRMLTPIWNRENVANVQIVFKDDLGTTAEYFDKHGIVRDVMQNHLLQIMAVLAMDRPVSLDPEDIRDAKLKVLRQVAKVVPTTDVVAGQYVADAKNPEKRPGYKENASVPKDSRTPTYAMVVLNVRNERWDGVPFILKAGKALDERRSEIRVQLKSTPGDIFAEDDGLSRGRFGAEPKDLGAGPNEFVLRIQPHEEMYMKLTIKEPGLGVRPVPSEMELSSRWREEQERKEVAGEAPRRAYERLILDAVNGHQAHFVRGDELEAAWAIVDPINAAIESGEVPVHEYARGTRGPKEADVLRKSVGHVTCPVPRDGALLSSSDDLCADEQETSDEGAFVNGAVGERSPVRTPSGDASRADAVSEDDGTPKHERRRSGVPASVVWGKEGEETSTPMPPEA